MVGAEVNRLWLIFSNARETTNDELDSDNGCAKLRLKDLTFNVNSSCASWEARQLKHGRFNLQQTHDLRMR